MQHNGALILMHVGNDFSEFADHAPRKHCRLDRHGWLGLCGETVRI